MWAFPLIFLEILHKKFMLLCKNRKFCIRILTARLNFDTVDEEVKNVGGNGNFLLDLPDLPLDCILEKLPPSDLCSLARVCSSLTERCSSDHLWERHMSRKWGSVLGHHAYREWQCRIAAKRARKFLHCKEKSKRLQLLSGILGFEKSGMMEEVLDLTSSLPVSVKSCYLALEAGKFWFPAQVFNREVHNGHVGFVLSCYDARLSYDSKTDNFIARYRAQGRCMIEEGIDWDRIRAPIIDTPANVLHVSECLDELKPDDSIEIQWRKNKGFPYGWWFGVVGHLESCSATQFNCHCHVNDSVILEFRQYSRGSRWRRTSISRKDHRETGNERDGFYGGVRKLYKQEEIAQWKGLWPNLH